MSSHEILRPSLSRLPHRLVTVIRQIGEYKGKQELYKQQAPEMLENLRQVAMIQSAESSNRLERLVADEKRIRALVAEKIAHANRPEAEIAGYCASYDHIPITDGVLQLHRDLMKHSGKGGSRPPTRSQKSSPMATSAPTAPH